MASELRIGRYAPRWLPALRQAIVGTVQHMRLVDQRCRTAVLAAPSHVALSTATEQQYCLARLHQLGPVSLHASSLCAPPYSSLSSGQLACAGCNPHGPNRQESAAGSRALRGAGHSCSAARAERPRRRRPGRRGPGRRRAGRRRAWRRGWRGTRGRGRRTGALHVGSIR